MIQVPTGAGEDGEMLVISGVLKANTGSVDGRPITTIVIKKRKNALGKKVILDPLLIIRFSPFACSLINGRYEIC